MAKQSHKLGDREKRFLVQRLACYDTPAEAAQALSDEFGVKITPQSAERYDPNKRAGQHLSAQLRELFAQTRKRFLENVEDIPEANRAVRIRHLVHAARAMKSGKNYVGMANMLKQIAEEVGNVYSNQRQITGGGGGPVKLEVADMTEEQLNARLAQLLTELAATETGSDAAAED